MRLPQSGAEPDHPEETKKKEDAMVKVRSDGGHGGNDTNSSEDVDVMNDEVDQTFNEDAWLEQVDEQTLLQSPEYTRLLSHWPSELVRGFVGAETANIPKGVLYDDEFPPGSSALTQQDVGVPERYSYFGSVRGYNSRYAFDSITRRLVERLRLYLGAHHLPKSVFLSNEAVRYAHLPHFWQPAPHVPYLFQAPHPGHQSTCPCSTEWVVVYLPEAIEFDSSRLQHPSDPPLHVRNNVSEVLVTCLLAETAYYTKRFIDLAPGDLLLWMLNVHASSPFLKFQAAIRWAQHAILRAHQRSRPCRLTHKEAYQVLRTYAKNLTLCKCGPGGTARNENELVRVPAYRSPNAIRERLQIDVIANSMGAALCLGRLYEIRRLQQIQLLHTLPYLSMELDELLFILSTPAKCLLSAEEQNLIWTYRFAPQFAVMQWPYAKLTQDNAPRPDFTRVIPILTRLPLNQDQQRWLGASLGWLQSWGLNSVVRLPKEYQRLLTPSDALMKWWASTVNQANENNAVAEWLEEFNPSYLSSALYQFVSRYAGSRLKWASQLWKLYLDHRIRSLNKSSTPITVHKELCDAICIALERQEWDPVSKLMSSPSWQGEEEKEDEHLDSEGLDRASDFLMRIKDHPPQAEILQHLISLWRVLETTMKDNKFQHGTITGSFRLAFGTIQLLYPLIFLIKPFISPSKEFLQWIASRSPHLYPPGGYPRTTSVDMAVRRAQQQGVSPRIVQAIEWLGDWERKPPSGPLVLTQQQMSQVHGAIDHLFFMGERWHGIVDVLRSCSKHMVVVRDSAEIRSDPSIPPWLIKHEEAGDCGLSVKRPLDLANEMRVALTAFSAIEPVLQDYSRPYLLTTESGRDPGDARPILPSQRQVSVIWKPLVSALRHGQPDRCKTPAAYLLSGEQYASPGVLRSSLDSIAETYGFNFEQDEHRRPRFTDNFEPRPDQMYSPDREWDATSTARFGTQTIESNSFREKTTIKVYSLNRDSVRPNQMRMTVDEGLTQLVTGNCADTRGENPFVFPKDADIEQIEEALRAFVATCESIEGCKRREGDSYRSLVEFVMERQVQRSVEELDAALSSDQCSEQCVTSAPPSHETSESSPVKSAYENLTASEVVGRSYVTREFALATFERLLIEQWFESVPNSLMAAILQGPRISLSEWRPEYATFTRSIDEVASLKATIFFLDLPEGTFVNLTLICALIGVVWTFVQPLGFGIGFLFCSAGLYLIDKHMFSSSKLKVDSKKLQLLKSGLPKGDATSDDTSDSMPMKMDANAVLTREERKSVDAPGVLTEAKDCELVEDFESIYIQDSWGPTWWPGGIYAIPGSNSEDPTTQPPTLERSVSNIDETQLPSNQESSGGEIQSGPLRSRKNRHGSVQMEIDLADLRPKPKPKPKVWPYVDIAHRLLDPEYAPQLCEKCKTGFERGVQQFPNAIRACTNLDCRIHLLVGGNAERVRHMHGCGMIASMSRFSPRTSKFAFSLKFINKGTEAATPLPIEFTPAGWFVTRSLQKMLADHRKKGSPSCDHDISPQFSVDKVPLHAFESLVGTLQPTSHRSLHSWYSNLIVYIGMCLALIIFLAVYLSSAARLSLISRALGLYFEAETATFLQIRNSVLTRDPDLLSQTKDFYNPASYLHHYFPYFTMFPDGNDADEIRTELLYKTQSKSRIAVTDVESQDSLVLLRRANTSSGPSFELVNELDADVLQTADSMIDRYDTRSWYSWLMTDSKWKLTPLISVCIRLPDSSFVMSAKIFSALDQGVKPLAEILLTARRNPSESIVQDAFEKLYAIDPFVAIFARDYQFDFDALRANVNGWLPSSWSLKFGFQSLSFSKRLSPETRVELFGRTSVPEFEICKVGQLPGIVQTGIIEDSSVSSVLLPREQAFYDTWRHIPIPPVLQRALIAPLADEASYKLSLLAVSFGADPYSSYSPRFERISSAKDPSNLPELYSRARNRSLEAAFARLNQSLLAGFDTNITTPQTAILPIRVSSLFRLPHIREQEYQELLRESLSDRNLFDRFRLLLLTARGAWTTKYHFERLPHIESPDLLEHHPIFTTQFQIYRHLRECIKERLLLKDDETLLDAYSPLYYPLTRRSYRTANETYDAVPPLTNIIRTMLDRSPEMVAMEQQLQIFYSTRFHDDIHVEDQPSLSPELELERYNSNVTAVFPLSAKEEERLVLAFARIYYPDLVAREYIRRIFDSVIATLHVPLVALKAPINLLKREQHWVKSSPGNYSVLTEAKVRAYAFQDINVPPVPLEGYYVAPKEFVLKLHSNQNQSYVHQPWDVYNAVYHRAIRPAALTDLIHVNDGDLMRYEFNVPWRKYLHMIVQFVATLLHHGLNAVWNCIRAGAIPIDLLSHLNRLLTAMWKSDSAVWDLGEQLLINTHVLPQPDEYLPTNGTRPYQYLPHDSPNGLDDTGISLLRIIFTIPCALIGCILHATLLVMMSIEIMIKSIIPSISVLIHAFFDYLIFLPSTTILKMVNFLSDWWRSLYDRLIGTHATWEDYEYTVCILEKLIGGARGRTCVQSSSSRGPSVIALSIVSFLWSRVEMLFYVLRFFPATFVHIGCWISHDVIQTSSFHQRHFDLCDEPITNPRNFSFITICYFLYQASHYVSYGLSLVLGWPRMLLDKVLMWHPSLGLLYDRFSFSYPAFVPSSTYDLLPILAVLHVFLVFKAFFGRPRFAKRWVASLAGVLMLALLCLAGPTVARVLGIWMGEIYRKLTTAPSFDYFQHWNGLRVWLDLVSCTFRGESMRTALPPLNSSATADHLVALLWSNVNVTNTLRVILYLWKFNLRLRRHATSSLVFMALVRCAPFLNPVELYILDFYEILRITSKMRSAGDDMRTILLFVSTGMITSLADVYFNLTEPYSTLHLLALLTRTVLVAYFVFDLKALKPRAPQYAAHPQIIEFNRFLSLVANPVAATIQGRIPRLYGNGMVPATAIAGTTKQPNRGRR